MRPLPRPRHRRVPRPARAPLPAPGPPLDRCPCRRRARRGFLAATVALLAGLKSAPEVPLPLRSHDGRSRRTAVWETAALNPPSWTPWPLVAGPVPHVSPVVLTFSGLPYRSSVLSARPIPGMGWLGAVRDAGRRSLGAHSGAAAGHRGGRHGPAALSAMGQAIYTKLIISAHIRSYKP